MSAWSVIANSGLRYSHLAHVLQSYQRCMDLGCRPHMAW